MAGGERVTENLFLGKENYAGYFYYISPVPVSLYNCMTIQESSIEQCMAANFITRLIMYSKGLLSSNILCVKGLIHIHVCM